MAIIWCMVPKIWNTMDRSFCHFGPFFAFLPPLTTQQIKILKKNEKPPGDIITLHMCTINDNPMRYGSWDMEHDTEFFVILDLFCPFMPLATQKIKIFRKWKKKPGDIIILNMCTMNDNHMMYGSWDIEHNRPNFLLFRTFFGLLPP